MSRPEVHPAHAPCDDCPRAALCRDQLLACDAYSTFMWERDQRERWRDRPRNPTHKTYVRIFGESLNG